MEVVASLSGVTMLQETITTALLPIRLFNVLAVLDSASSSLQKLERMSGSSSIVALQARKVLVVSSSGSMRLKWQPVFLLQLLTPLRKKLATLATLQVPSLLPASNVVRPDTGRRTALSLLCPILQVLTMSPKVQAILVTVQELSLLPVSNAISLDIGQRIARSLHYQILQVLITFQKTQATLATMQEASLRPVSNAARPDIGQRTAPSLLYQILQVLTMFQKVQATLAMVQELNLLLASNVARLDIGQRIALSLRHLILELQHHSEEEADLHHSPALPVTNAVNPVTGQGTAPVQLNQRLHLAGSRNLL